MTDQEPRRREIGLPCKQKDRPVNLLCFEHISPSKRGIAFIKTGLLMMAKVHVHVHCSWTPGACEGDRNSMKPASSTITNYSCSTSKIFLFHVRSVLVVDTAVL